MTTTEIFRVILPQPDNRLGPNGSHCHYRVISKLRKVCRTRTAAALLMSGVPSGVFPEPRHYCYIWHYRGIKPDDDNITARCKSVKDGLCDAMKLNDRNLQATPLAMVHDNKDPRLEVVFFYGHPSYEELDVLTKDQPSLLENVPSREHVYDLRKFIPAKRRKS